LIYTEGDTERHNRISEYQICFEDKNVLRHNKRIIAICKAVFTSNYAGFHANELLFSENSGGQLFSC